MRAVDCGLKGKHTTNVHSALEKSVYIIFLRICSGAQIICACQRLWANQGMPQLLSSIQRRSDNICTIYLFVRIMKICEVFYTLYHTL